MGYSALRSNSNVKLDLPPFLVLAGGGLAVLALWTAHALNSHAAGLARDPWLAVIVDIIHLLAASVWIGGLVALTIAFLLPIFRGQLDLPMSIRVVWGRFSFWAAVSVALLFLTGLYSVGRQVVSLDALLTSLYGRAILGKVSAMLLMGLFGLLNAMLVHPVLARPLARLFHRDSDWTPISARQFPTVVLLELTLGLVVLFVAGIITATEPARGPRFPTFRGEVPSSQTQSVEDLLITLAVRPNQPGENIITVRAISSWRPPPGEIIRVILRIKPQDEDIDAISVDAFPVDNGEYQLGGGYFRFSGVWDVDVVIRRRGIEDQVAHFDWIIPPAGPGRPPIISNYPWESILTGIAGALLVGLVASLAGIWLIKRF